MPNKLADDLNLMIATFERSYQQFVADGGLDRTTCVDEDYERAIRQDVYCPHSLPRQRCHTCRKPVPKSEPWVNPWGG